MKEEKKKKNNTSETEKHRIMIYCMRCGSTDVTRYASARWNVDTQDWELTGVYDNPVCEHCNSETVFGDAPLSPL